MMRRSKNFNCFIFVVVKNVDAPARLSSPRPPSPTSRFHFSHLAPSLDFARHGTPGHRLPGTPNIVAIGKRITSTLSEYTYRPKRLWPMV